MVERKYHNESWLREKYVIDDLTLSEIGDLCGVTKDAIHTWTSKFDLNPEQKYRDKDWLEDKLNSQLSVAEVAEEYNIGLTTIWTWKKKHGIEIEKPDYQSKSWLSTMWRERDMSLSEISEESNHDPSCGAISQWISKFDILKKHHDPDWLHTQYEVEEKSTIEMAKMVERSPQTISNNLEKHGIDRIDLSNKGDKYDAPWEGVTGNDHPGSKMTGEDHPSYIGLDEAENWRRSGHWKWIRTKIRERDQYTCQQCGGNGKEVHHITPTSAGGRKYDPRNLVTTCDSCHQDIHWNTHLRTYRIPREYGDEETTEWIESPKYQ